MIKLCDIFSLDCPLNNKFLSLDNHSIWAVFVQFLALHAIFSVSLSVWRVAEVGSHSFSLRSWRVFAREISGGRRPVGSIPTEVKRFFSLPRVVPCFPLLGLTPSGLFMGLSSTLICTSELTLCSTICVPSATRQNIHMHPYFLFAAIHHLKSSPTFSVRPCSSVGRVTVDLLRRSWVRFPPRSKYFFSLPRVVPCFPLLAICGSIKYL